LGITSIRLKKDNQIAKIFTQNEIATITESLKMKVEEKLPVFDIVIPSSNQSIQKSVTNTTAVNSKADSTTNSPFILTEKKK
jgi:hypothetical protein